MYELLLFLHLVAVVVGIGNTAMNPVYGTLAKNRQGPVGLGISEANFTAARIGEWFIYAIPVFGVLLVLERDGFDFDQTWIWLSIVLYVIALGIAHALLFRNVKRMIALQQELVAMGPPPGQGPGAAPAGPPSQVAQLEKLGNTVGAAGTVLHLIALVLIGLMVWKPGL